MTTLTLLDCPEEVLHHLVLLLVDDTDYEGRGYPRSIYNHASCDIVSLSLVDHQLRRICLPFLFSYLKCRSIAELENLESKCSIESVFARLVRTLNLAFRWDQIDPASGIILRLLPHLAGIRLLDLGGGTIDAALLAAINHHPTLETSFVRNLHFLSYTSLDKDLFLSGDGPDLMRPVIERGVRISSLSLKSTLPLFLDTTVAPDLRRIDFQVPATFGWETTTELARFSRFVANQPILTSIYFWYDPLSWQAESNGITMPQLASFLEAVNAESLVGTTTLDSVTMSRSSPNGGFSSWEVTGLELEMKPLLVEPLTLAGAMFPKVSSITIFCPQI
ncbi:hypothetical protein C8J56DRAFT_968877 [Mycena floridula]|nr:hypothetical protein C8J56DRAFT_968877 [Mycena floridula]